MELGERACLCLRAEGESLEGGALADDAAPDLV